MTVVLIHIVIAVEITVTPGARIAGTSTKTADQGKPIVQVDVVVQIGVTKDRIQDRQYEVVHIRLPDGVVAIQIEVIDHAANIHDVVQ